MAILQTVQYYTYMWVPPVSIKSIDIKWYIDPMNINKTNNVHAYENNNVYENIIEAEGFVSTSGAKYMCVCVRVQTEL